MSGRDWRAFGRIHARVYEWLGGRFVSSLGQGRKVLLLKTIGRKTGLERTTPLVYMPVERDLVVYASNGGKETPPSWWLNLQTNPDATVQIGRDLQAVRARQATEEEYRVLWPKAAAYNSHWASYERNVTRKIPLVILKRVDV